MNAARRPAMAKAPPPAIDERLAKLETIVAQQAEQIAELAQYARIVKAIQAVFSPNVRAATDRELDDPKYGDPEVKLVPRDWTGPSFKNRRFSECSVEFLEVLAETYDYFERTNRASGAKTPKGAPKADFDAKSARLCRGWIRRLESGWKPPEKPTLANGFKIAPLGGPAGFGHTSSFGAPSFGGGPNPFAKPTAGPTPEENDAAEPEAPLKTETRTVEPEPVGVPLDDDGDLPDAASGSIALDDDDDDLLPVNGAT